MRPCLLRRDLLGACLGGLTLGMGVDVHAAGETWLPYAPSEIKVLVPRLTDTRANEVRTFLPGITRPRVTPRTSARPELVQALRRPPTAYLLTAQRSGVPAWVLFGIALQESQMAFGRATLPYPWTLCVRGRGERYASYEQTLAALRRYVRSGITNVDCGAMQVNWHWHQQKLQSFEQALDPYPNLAVGARILREHFQAQGNWFAAAGLYHAGSVNASSTRERALDYARKVFVRLRRMGVDPATLLPAAVARRYV
ncbi:transglycosylase SLT domain-containing protein [Variovorax sp. ZS18.2.2]|uniref:transglycosylase SLT domain-containing protein n=1 Tax=Variovorax sp. ZS18.2.2 TaxID=2971255 RepID=UPI002151DE72|nr:transglycosylase SLT domain-containing protein [Variovorax sp. ZS18.2.2]MCR6480979.1 transglycosylase SLT domain-containing protein [Variovorax sp. ZS18.2.2]